MNDEQWEQLESVMARLAEGDLAAVVTLYVTFGATLAGVVRRHLGRFGVRGVTPDDLDGMVMDSCFALADCAPGWDPSKRIAPWTWAERRVANVVSGWIGQYSDELDDQAYDVPSRGPGRSSERGVLEMIDAAGAPMCRLLRDAFDAARVSPRDRELLLETELQASLGDPSPAATAALLFEMTPAAVRQAVKRAKDRLRRLASSDVRFASLADLPMLG